MYKNSAVAKKRCWFPYLHTDILDIIDIYNRSYWELMEAFHLFKLFIQWKMLRKSKTLDLYEAEREVLCLYRSLSGMFMALYSKVLKELLVIQHNLYRF